MPTPLAQALSDEAAIIADELFTGLHTAQTPHYQGAAEGLLRRRCRALVEAFVDSCDGEPEAFLAHVRKVTRERIAEGYYLVEIQRALSALEAAAWRVVVNRSNINGLVKHLGIVTSVIGSAKDELARAYLDDAASVRERLRLLSQGTDAHIEVDESEARVARG